MVLPKLYPAACNLYAYGGGKCTLGPGARQCHGSFQDSTFAHLVCSDDRLTDRFATMLLASLRSNWRPEAGTTKTNEDKRDIPSTSVDFMFGSV